MENKANRVFRNTMLFIGAILILLLSVVTLQSYWSKYLHEKEARNLEAKTQKIVNLLKRGELDSSDVLVDLSHKNTNFEVKPVYVRVGFGSLEDDAVGLSLLEAEARYYAKDLVNPQKPKNGWYSLLTKVRRAYFYGNLTGGLERYGLTKDGLESIWNLGQEEMINLSKPEKGNFLMMPIILDAPLYQIETPKGLVVAPGGLNSMAEEVLGIVKELAVKNANL